MQDNKLTIAGLSRAALIPLQANRKRMENEMSDWIIQEVAAPAPRSVKSRYVIVRVLEVASNVPYVRSVRSKDVRRVVYESSAVPAGWTYTRGGYQQARTHAESLIARRAEIESAEHARRIEHTRDVQERIALALANGEQLSAADLAALPPM